MIDFRYHIVSIVAVFLALALGLFLGSTTLQGAVLGNIRSQVNAAQKQNNSLQKQVDQEKARADRNEAFVAAAAPFAVKDLMTPVESVSIISLPGVDPGLANTVGTMVTSANGSVASQVQLQPGFLDPSNQQQALLDSLADRLRPPGVRLPAGGTGAARAAAELAAVLATKPGHTALPAGRMQSVLSGFSDAHLINVAGSVANARPASLTVLVVPGPGGVGTGNQQTATALALGLTRDLAAASVGTVLAGPLSAADSNGLLQAEKGSADRPGNVATVQSVDTVGGQVAAVFALVEVFDGRNGDFGPGADTPLPTPSPSP